MSFRQSAGNVYYNSLRKQLCRLCFSESASCLNVFETVIQDRLTLAAMFTKYLGVNMLPDDDLPQSVCCDCLEEVIDLNHITQGARRTLRYLVWRENSLALAHAKENEDCSENTTRVELRRSESDRQLERSIWDDMDGCSLEWMNVDTEHKKYHCQSCGRAFHSQKRLKLHSEDCLESFTYRCSDCREVLFDSDELNRHKYLFHSHDKRFPCGRCLKRFRTRKRLVKHIKKHDFQCKPRELSGLMFNNGNTVVDRQCDKSPSDYSVKSETKPLVINKISAESNDGEHESNAATKPGSETDVVSDNCYKCATCDKICESRKKLIVHIKESHSSGKAFICSICNTGFTSKLYLAVHHYAHDKPFTCEVCGKGFLFKISYKRHTMICQKIIQHKCEICGKLISSRGNLKIHMFQHSIEKSFACTQCPKRYKARTNLYTHVRITHLKILPHECGVCGRKFSKREKLMLHLSIHSDEKPFKCAFCEKFFKLKNYVRRHEKKIHFKEIRDS